MKQNHIRFSILTACILVTSILQAQSLKNLESNKGFKIYKLGTKSNPGYGMKKKDEEGVDKVYIDYTRDRIGEIAVKAIELYYLKDTLAKIFVRVSPENYIRLIEACKSSFGPPTADISNNEATAKAKPAAANSNVNYKDQYIWKTPQFSMEYVYSYPKISGDVYGAKELYLVYTLNDYSSRLKRVNKKYSSKDF